MVLIDALFKSADQIPKIGETFGVGVSAKSLAIEILEITGYDIELPVETREAYDEFGKAIGSLMFEDGTDPVKVVNLAAERAKSKAIYRYQSLIG